MTIHDLTALLGVLLWPVVVLVLAILLRREIPNLISRVREIAGPGNLKVAFDPKKLEEIAEDAKRGNTSTKSLAERLERSLTVFDNLEARILRALLDDDGRAMYNYQTSYYRPALDSLLKQGYVQKAGKGLALTPEGKQKTKEYLLTVLDRIPNNRQ
jgi:hypothetical protein